MEDDELKVDELESQERVTLTHLAKVSSMNSIAASVSKDSNGITLVIISPVTSVSKKTVSTRAPAACSFRHKSRQGKNYEL